MDIEVKGLKEMDAFGINLGKILKAGDIICLNGDLGTGKTTLSKSIGKGLEVDDYITSPTFSLVNEYEGRLAMYHFDVYRLENVEEIYDLGFDEYFYGEGVSIIEWAEKIEEFLPEERIVINIEKDKEDINKRYINISGRGKRYSEVIKELEKN